MVERLADALDVTIQELLPAMDVETTETESRRQTQQVFEAILAKAGRETLTFLKSFLERLAESHSLHR